MNALKLFSIVLLVVFVNACTPPAPENKSGIEKANFEKVIDGKEVTLWKLTNENGCEIDVTNYGGNVVSILVPDKDGEFVDVACGYENVEGYENGTSFIGSFIGRYGNRIAKGKFSLDGTEYQLPLNDGPNHLHGGPKGYYKVVMDGEKVAENKLVLKYVSADMEQGYPGALSITMTYELTDDNALYIDYKATTDKKTIVNLTNHTYFNLSGQGAATITDHELMIDANGYTPTDSTLIPTGEIATVEGTPFDFREPKPISEALDMTNEQIKLGKGVDHNFVLNNQSGEVKTVATLYSPVTGITMDVLTDQPGIQIYSGNFLDGTITGKGGKTYPFRGAMCLETQHYPDSPNQPQFPTTVLEPGETYMHTCVYKFYTK